MVRVFKSNAFNMRVVNLDNFIASSSRRTTGRSNAQSIAVLRAKLVFDCSRYYLCYCIVNMHQFDGSRVMSVPCRAGAITNAAKSLDLLRQLLQRYINEEIDAVIKRYLEVFFLALLFSRCQNSVM